MNSTLSVTFCGAARTVTGSLYYLEYHGVDGSKFTFALDAGMFQVGQKVNLFRINSHLLFDPKKLDAIVLTHAHLDHCGRLPYLVKMGFGGKIYSTKATQEIAQIVMEDAARQQTGGLHQEEFYFNEEGMRKNEIEGESSQHKQRQSANPTTDDEGLKSFEAYKKIQQRHQFTGYIPHQSEKIQRMIEKNQPLVLYTSVEVSQTMGRFMNQPYEKWFEIHPNLEVQFHDAGHILGSAYVYIREKSSGKTIVFSGDLGNPGKPIIQDPVLPRQQENLTHIFCETTYGDRLHGTLDPKSKLEIVVRKALLQKGKVFIPSFSVERAQEIIYLLVELMRENKLPQVPIFLDSPMASKVLEVCLDHPELYDNEMRNKVANRKNPLRDNLLRVLESVEESKSLNHRKDSCIIIAGSGMVNGGRILKHLQFNIENPNHTLVFAGYQAAGTLGRQILDGIKHVTIEGREFEVKCAIQMVSEFSGHADQAMLKHWVHGLLPAKKVPTLFLMHGEKNSSLTFGKELTSLLPGRIQTYWPHFAETIELWK